MSDHSRSTVSETADALTVIRCGERARQLGVVDPCAAWFVDETGRKMAKMAQETDRVYEEFNLVRFLLTTRRLRALAPGFRQALFLGAGFDCRPLYLEEFRAGRTKVFEIDIPAKLARKAEVLAGHGMSPPLWVRPVPGDLARDDIPHRLIQAGYDPEVPALVLAEGLLFFLEPRLTEMVLDPNWLPLARGSRLIFDCWTDLRVETLNRRIRDKIGIELFHRFTLDSAPSNPEDVLRRRGWNTITVEPLDSHAETEDEFPGSWLLVEAVR